MHLEGGEYRIVMFQFLVEIIVRVNRLAYSESFVSSFVHRFPCFVEQVFLDVSHRMETFAVDILQCLSHHFIIE